VSFGEGGGEGESSNRDSGVVLREDVGVGNRMGAFSSSSAAVAGTEGPENEGRTVVASSPALLVVINQPLQ
jgi:hypothetical protein